MTFVKVTIEATIEGPVKC